MARRLLDLDRWSEDRVEAEPLEKNESMLTMFFRKPHLALEAARDWEVRPEVDCDAATSSDYRDD